MSVQAALAKRFGPKRSRVVSRTSRSRGRRGQSSAALRALQEQQSAYNKTQSERFKQLMGMTKDIRRQALKSQRAALKETRKFGKTRMAELESAREGRLANVEQEATSRGLGNTTIRSSMQRGVESDIEREKSAVRENIARQRAGLLSQQAGLQFDLGQFSTDAFLSRRDQFPQVGNILELLSRMG